MREVHPHTQPTAEVAEVAAAQGHFWEIHDLLFARQNARDGQPLVRYARELDLHAEAVAQELAEHMQAARVERQPQSGVGNGVTSTPTFFIDGVRYDGSVSLSKLLLAIRQLHPDVHVGETQTETPRIPRIRWPREEER